MIVAIKIKEAEFVRSGPVVMCTAPVRGKIVQYVYPASSICAEYNGTEGGEELAIYFQALHEKSCNSLTIKMTNEEAAVAVPELFALLSDDWYSFHPEEKAAPAIKR